jgi:hypothetical protein
VGSYINVGLVLTLAVWKKFVYPLTVAPNFVLCVGVLVFGVPHVGLFFGFCFVFGLFFVACWGVAATIFFTWCMVLVDFVCGNMQKSSKNPQAPKSTKNKK